MSTELGRIIVEDFLKNSWFCVETIVRELSTYKGDKKRKIQLFYFKDGRKNEMVFESDHFFLRGSVEYSNPQLTVEEVQGVIVTRLLEVCGNYFSNYGLHETAATDVNVICERLNKPPEGAIISFLLNTDEVEPDRYSMNPLKESIVTSGQSAFPSAFVKTEGLKLDQKFMQKYEGTLVSRKETDLITHHLETCNNSYLDMVDAVKYEQLENLSVQFGMNLSIPSVRMPLSVFQKETTDGLLHYIVKETHTDFHSVENAYNCMGRSIKNRTTLLTVPHSKKGYGSKRAARGKLYFEGSKLKNIKVNYRTTPLYPNAIDTNDVSVANADDSLVVEGEKLVHYNFNETPSSPQFFLYSLASPENAAVWHGIGAFAATDLLKSYTSVRVACSRNQLVRNLEEYSVPMHAPLHFNLVPKNMWVHPVHRNIDASIGCVDNLKDLAAMGMRLEYLSAYERNQ